MVLELIDFDLRLVRVFQRVGFLKTPLKGVELRLEKEREDFLSLPERERDAISRRARCIGSGCSGGMGL